MSDAARLIAIPVRGMGEVRAGDNLAELLWAKLAGRVRAGDVLVVTHKVVSKAEGRVVELAALRPSARARRWAKRWPVDARVIELALRESRRVLRMEHGILITETVNGLVCANSGVDLSNLDVGRSDVLLPKDPDASARRLFTSVRRRAGFSVPVIITDTFGRPWREGLTEVAIGVAGMEVYRDYRSQRDPYGYRLRVSLEAAADTLAAVAGLACGKLSRCPACIIRGFHFTPGGARGQDLVRPPERDLFR